MVWATTWETRLLDPGSINKKPHVRKLFHLRNRLNCTIKWLIIFMHYKSMPGYVIYWCVPWVVGGSKEALWFSCWFLTHFPQTSEWTTSSNSFWILWFAAVKWLQWCFLLIHVWTFIQTNSNYFDVHTIIYSRVVKHVCMCLLSVIFVCWYVHTRPVVLAIFPYFLSYVHLVNPLSFSAILLVAEVCVTVTKAVTFFLVSAHNPYSELSNLVVMQLRNIFLLIFSYQK